MDNLSKEILITALKDYDAGRRTAHNTVVTLRHVLNENWDRDSYVKLEYKTSAKDRPWCKLSFKAKTKLFDNE